MTGTIKGMVAQLRDEAPPLLPVRVYVRSEIDGGWLGSTALRFVDDLPHHFVITLRKTHRAVMRDTLMHEWAHAIAWHQGHDSVCDHDPEWALAYSRVYQLLVEP